jgi:hypothetical protein
MTRGLLIAISDRLSDLVQKGEVTARYYKPGNVFEKSYCRRLWIEDMRRAAYPSEC